MSEFPIFTGRFYTRGHRSSVPVSTLNSTGSYTPEDAITIDESATPDEYYAGVGGQTETFPWSQFGEFGEPLAEVLNLRDVDAIGNGYVPAEHAPFTAEDRGDTDPLYYEDLICNAYYNVKTWQVTASAGGKSISETIYAGASGSNGSPGTRPLSGKRYKFGASGTFSDSDGTEFLSLSLTIGLGARFPVENLFAAPVDTALLPNLSATLNYSDSDAGTSNRIRVIGLNAVDTWITGKTLDTNFNFLGVPVWTYEDLDGGLTYSVSISANEFWTTSDDWYPV